MDIQRFIQRQQEFLRAASRLREAVSQQSGDILRDATIQRFEFTFNPTGKPCNCSCCIRDSWLPARARH